MNLIITGHHLDVTPALQNRITDKVTKVLENFDQVLNVKVKLSIDNSKDKLQRAECSINVKHDQMFVESAHVDMYAAIDELVDKIQRQMVKYKERHNSYRKARPEFGAEMEL